MPPHPTPTSPSSPLPQNVLESSASVTNSSQDSERMEKDTKSKNKNKNNKPPLGMTESEYAQLVQSWSTPPTPSYDSLFTSTEAYVYTGVHREYTSDPGAATVPLAPPTHPTPFLSWNLIPLLPTPSLSWNIDPESIYSWSSSPVAGLNRHEASTVGQDYLHQMQTDSFNCFLRKNKIFDALNRSFLVCFQRQKVQRERLRLFHAEMESKHEKEDDHFDLNNFHLVSLPLLVSHREKHVSILCQQQKKKKKTKKMSKAKLNSRIKKIKNGTDAKSEKLVQLEMEKEFKLFRKKYQALHGGSENSRKNELKFEKNMETRKEMYGGQIPLEKILNHRANKSILVQLLADQEWSLRYHQFLTHQTVKNLSKKSERKRMIRALASSDSFHQMESTLEKSVLTTNSPNKLTCLAVSESCTGPPLISRHDTNLVEEERNESEPYYIGFNERRYTNDEAGRDQEEMDMEDDLEEEREKYSRWGADAAYMD